ncbi:hypothetical protein ACEZDB_35320 [Streptacidiphilus sp. N1-3]|uniref:Uncharacterized protein n=1 Tax=Streptacidiphilus alkalitolerans TaxID=3342712 RepID=A0ABV6XCF6_9ACTN
MESSRWFNTEQAFAPGRELFRSTRRFSLWAQTVSHGQTLLRSRKGADGRSGEPTRVDLLFKPVRAMKLRQDYHGLVVRCATAEEAAGIREQVAPTPTGDDRILVLETGGSPDFVVSGAFGWYEDLGGDLEPSPFSSAVEEGRPPWSDPVLLGVDGGLTSRAASLEDLVEAVARTRYRYVYVLMFRLGDFPGAAGPATPTSVFLTRAEAERERARRLAGGAGEWWIEQTPIAV